MLCQLNGTLQPLDVKQFNDRSGRGLVRLIAVPSGS
jgi:hypothetical protein